MCRNTILNIFMVIRLDCGLAFIPGGVLEAHTFLSESVSPSVHFSALAGAGLDGDLIGTTMAWSMVGVLTHFIAAPSMTATLTSMGITAATRPMVGAIASPAVIALRVVLVDMARLHGQGIIEHLRPEVMPEPAPALSADIVAA